MNFKRKKCKRVVRCTLCTPNRWKGNGKDRRPGKEKAIRKELSREADDFNPEAYAAFKDKVFEELERMSRKKFKPFVLYDPNGDFIEFVVDDLDYVAETIDKNLVVYRTRESRSIIGARINHASMLVED